MSKHAGSAKILSGMEPEVGEWFTSKFGKMTEPQERAIPLIRDGKNVLISSPTGSGKTLTAFLAILNELLALEKRGELEKRIYCVYVSPLKALANDIEKNLLSPLSEISVIAENEPGIRVAVRSGDTSNSDRQKMLRKPPHILITTPESLGIILSAPKFRELLVGVRWAIVDEIHEICSSKRGVQLALNLERLRELAGVNFVRVGLSATQAPIEEIGLFLGGHEGGHPRPMQIIEAKMGKDLDVRVMAPTDRMNELPVDVVNAALYERLEGMIRSHTTTIVFTNTRSGTERVALKLKEMGIESMAAHHGSLSKETRLEVEGQLRGGQLQAVVTSTSLELGIDIGSVDLVAQIGSPKSISKGLQRVGRSGHGVGRTSKGRLIAFDNDDLIECAVLVKNAKLGHIDRVSIPRNCLDVLSQALVGMSLERVWKTDDAYEIVRRAHPYRELTRDDFDSVMRYLGGQEMEDIYSKLWHDPDKGEFGRKKGGRMIYYLNSGTIPDEADYQVFSDKGRHLGKLSEKFVERLNSRDVFVLGGRTYEYMRARGTKVFVKDATGRRPTVPSWTGEMLPRSFDLSMQVGAFRGELDRALRDGSREEVIEWLEKDYFLDADAAGDIAAYASEQMAMAGFLPSDRTLCVEAYSDDKGQHHAIFHFPFGRRVNDALARGYASALSKKLKANVKVSVIDDAFIVTAAKQFDIRALPGIVKTKDFESDLRSAIMGTELYKQRFRHVAGRSFLVLRNYMGREISVSRQQMRSQRILEALADHPEFPVVKETLSEIFNEVLDVPHALKVMGWIESGDVEIRHIKSEEAPTPFAYNVLVSDMADIVLLEDKAALLREMHSKVLKRILGDGMEPLFTPEAAEKHFREKFPAVASKADVPALMKASGPLRLFTTRGRNIYEWSGVPPEELNAWCEELIAEGDLVSARAREVVWAVPEDVPKLAALFADAAKTKAKEKELLSLLADGKVHVSAELEKALKLDRKKLKDVATELERKYLISRADGSGKSYRRLEVKTVDRAASMRDLAIRILGSSGPMLAEELALELGAGVSETKNLLGLLDEEGLLFSGGITYLETQFALKADVEALRGADGDRGIGVEDVYGLLLDKQFKKYPSVASYFEANPDVGLSMDLAWRVDNYNPAHLDAMWASGDVVVGRFVGGRVRYVAKRDAELLHSFRGPGRLSEREKTILELIEKHPGIGIEDVVKKTGLDKEVAREAVYMLDRGLFVSRAVGSSAGRNHYVRYAPETIDENPLPSLIERYVRSFGPATVRQLERLLRAERISLDATLSALVASGKVRSFAVSGEKELYYVAEEDFESLGKLKPDDEVRVLSILDPFTLHFSREIEARWGEGWYYPIFKGTRPCGIVELWEMSGRVEVRNVELEPPVTMAEVLAALEKISTYFDAMHMDTMTVAGAQGKLVVDMTEKETQPFLDAGFAKAQSWLAKGIDTERVLTLDEFVSFLLWRQGLAPQTRFSSIGELDETLVGLRSEDEAMARLSSPPRGLSFKTVNGLNLGFGIPNVMMWLTEESARRYRDALQEPETPAERTVIRALRRSGGMGRKALVEGLMGGASGREALNRMFRKCMVMRNSFGRYVAVPGLPGDRAEARKWLVERMVRNFVVACPESISVYTGSEIGAPEARGHLHTLRSEGKLAKGFLLGEDSASPWMPNSIPYWMPAEFASKPVPGVEGDMLIGPGWKDRVSHYLRPWVQQKLGLGSAYLVFTGGRLVGGFVGRKVGGGVRVKKFSGNEEAWQVARRQAAMQGQRLTMAVEDEAEEERDDDSIDEWAKKLMLTTVRKK
ncbi:MAG: ATP-dependent helicase [Methanobacteriota archaeon]